VEAFEWIAEQIPPDTPAASTRPSLSDVIVHRTRIGNRPTKAVRSGFLDRSERDVGCVPGWRVALFPRGHLASTTAGSMILFLPNRAVWVAVKMSELYIVLSSCQPNHSHCTDSWLHKYAVIAADSNEAQWAHRTPIHP
jgi:hypothetical protein